MTSWLITDKGDEEARRLVDGESIGAAPHYSRQTPGARMFTRNGQNLVFITRDARAVWVTFRPTPGKARRPDGLDAWECALFRNETARPRLLSSDLIREAVELSRVLWGAFPADGFVTFIRPDAVRPKRDVGYCYLCAGWERRGTASDGKPRFWAPLTDVPRPLSAWAWAGERGGKLRAELEEQGVTLAAAARRAA